MIYQTTNSTTWQPSSNQCLFSPQFSYSRASVWLFCPPSGISTLGLSRSVVWLFCLPFVVLSERMGARSGDIPLESSLEISRRRDSERFVDRSHPADSFIYCSTPGCHQSWLWTSRLSRANQVCLNCDRTWHLSYLDNGYNWWLPHRMSDAWDVDYV